MNSKSEINDLKTFGIDFETKYLSCKEEDKTDSVIETTPLAKEFKAFLSRRAYRKQITELGVSLSSETEFE